MVTENKTEISAKHDLENFKAGLRTRINTALSKLDYANSNINVGRDDIKGQNLISRGIDALSIVPAILRIDVPRKTLNKIANVVKEEKFRDRMSNFSEVSNKLEDRKEFVDGLVDELSEQYVQLRDSDKLPDIKPESTYRQISNALNGLSLKAALTTPNFENKSDVHPYAKLYAEDVVTSLYDGSVLASLKNGTVEQAEEVTKSQEIIKIVSNDLAEKYQTVGAKVAPENDNAQQSYWRDCVAEAQSAKMVDQVQSH